METTRRLTPEQIRSFEENGYLVSKGLFGSSEVRGLLDNFMEMHAGGAPSK